MKGIDIDQDLCQGTKECASIAAEAVEFTDEGIAQATGTGLPDAVAHQMEAACPSMAITVFEL